MRYLRYDYNLLNLQPVGLECVELEHKLFNETNRSAWFALSMANTPEEVAARKEAFLRLPSVERVVEVATKLPADVEPKTSDHRTHPPAAGAICPRQVPQIPVTPPAELDRDACRRADDARVAIGRRPGGRRAATTARTCCGRFRPTNTTAASASISRRMAADLLARLQMLQAASTPEPPQLADLPESVATRFVGKTGRYLMQVYSKANIWDVGPMGQFVARRAERRPRGHRQSAASLRGLAAHEAELRAGRLVCLAGDHAVGAAGLPPAQPHAVGGAADGRGHACKRLGLMGLLDIPLNPANMIVLPLTLGHRHGKRHQSGARAALPAGGSIAAPATP